MKILIDEMFEGFVEDLRNNGYEVQSVKQLINEGKKMGSDFSVLTYAKDNDMTLVSADLENQKGCEENGIKFVQLNKVTLLKQILDGLNGLD